MNDFVVVIALRVRAQCTYRLDRVIACIVQLLNVIGSNAMFLKAVEGLIADGNLYITLRVV